MLKRKFSRAKIYISAFLMVFALLITFRSQVTPTIISGNSMYPTLKDGEYCLSQKYYDYLEIERGNIVVVKENENYYIVKRVIGLPGETIRCENGTIYINDLELNDYTDAYTEDFKSITLGENEYFIMGDNRQHSKDSRHIGAIKKDDIVSIHMFVLTSIEDFGLKR